MKPYDECIKALQTELGRHKFLNLVSPLLEVMERDYTITLDLKVKNKIDLAMSNFSQRILTRVQVLEDGSEILDLSDVRQIISETKSVF